jgi:hypothetical protein
MTASKFDLEKHCCTLDSKIRLWKLDQMKKDIEMKEAAPHPWRICESRGGKLYIYANGEDHPLSILKMRKRPTRRELATLQLICDAVNDFRERNPQFK